MYKLKPCKGGGYHANVGKRQNYFLFFLMKASFTDKMQPTATTKEDLDQ